MRRLNIRGCEMRPVHCPRREPRPYGVQWTGRDDSRRYRRGIGSKGRENVSSGTSASLACPLLIHMIVHPSQTFIQFVRRYRTSPAHDPGCGEGIANMKGREIRPGHSPALHPLLLLHFPTTHSDSPLFAAFPPHPPSLQVSHNSYSGSVPSSHLESEARRPLTKGSTRSAKGFSIRIPYSSSDEWDRRKGY